MTPRSRTWARRSSGVRAACSVLLLPAASWLCLPAGAQGLVVVPSVSITETLTNNVDLSAAQMRADFITQISPGLSVSARSGGLQGSLAYSLNGLVFAKDTSQNSIYHSLSSSGKFSMLEGRVGVDVLANAGRQVVSAFGVQSASATQFGGNQAQVFSYSLAPFWAGRLIGGVNYQTRLTFTQSTSDAAGGSGDAMALNGSVGIDGRIGPLGWGVDASRLSSQNELRPRSHNNRLFGSLNYSPAIDLLLALRAGTESDDLRSGRSERTATWGVGMTWMPGPRTSVRMDLDRRFFGRSHAVTMSHRMARTMWTFTDTRSLETSGISGRGALSNYDFFSQQFASISDASLRDVLVRDLLAARNLDPSGRELAAGFLTNGPTVQRSQNLSATYQGLRSTFTVLAFQTSSRSAALSGNGDEQAGANAVRQQGLSLSLSHRLTPGASIVVSVSQQKTKDSGSLAGNDLKTITATWSAKLGPYSNVTLGVRHADADSDLNPYQESAVIGSIRMQF